MRCSRCGKCCEETEMELSNQDMRRLEEAGYRRDRFSFRDGHAIRLVNADGWCYFYIFAEKKCRVYRDRPLGCRLYPVMYSANNGAVIDGLCPMGHTISEKELKTKGKILRKLLRKMDEENTSAPDDRRREL